MPSVMLNFRHYPSGKPLNATVKVKPRTQLGSLRIMVTASLQALGCPMAAFTNMYKAAPDGGYIIFGEDVDKCKDTVESEGIANGDTLYLDGLLHDMSYEASAAGRARLQTHFNSSVGPLHALWAVLRDSSLPGPSYAMEVVLDSRCGLERLFTIDARSESKRGFLRRLPILKRTSLAVFPLVLATLAGRLDVMAELINAGADAKGKFRGGGLLLLPIHAAALCGNVAAIELLVCNGADVNEPRWNRYGLRGTPLHFAVSGRSPAAVQALIDLGCDVAALDIDGNSALNVAARIPIDVEPAITSRILQLLMDAGGTPNYRTALRSLAENGSVSALEVLCREDPAQVRSNSVGVLEAACRHPHMEMIVFLLNTGLSAKRDRKEFVENSLQWAIKGMNFDLTRLLLDHGELPTGNDLTAAGCHVNYLEMLSDAGADLSATNSNGLTALHVLSSVPMQPTLAIPCIDWLLSEGVDCNVRDRQGRTALHLALTVGYCRLESWSPILSHLLDKVKIDINAGNDEGTTPLHLAAAAYGSITPNGKDITTRLLKNPQLDINRIDNKGDTALHVAAQKAIVPLINLLVEKGAELGIRNHAGLTPSDVVIAPNWMSPEAKMRVTMALAPPYDHQDMLRKGQLGTSLVADTSSY